ncbi:formylglycine-generating enzyme family protein [Oceanibacterium hippocampi]|uniref:formylglycine-generating enzyme family protein n=1 Tax=Oceanibacterium hippocampi TaxID=745714 RepID=UPI001C38E334|nr:SUMF1/EgtB/PvdO family nonheme iron enzyme [Oceanibacterium hippocampi]
MRTGLVVAALWLAVAPLRAAVPEPPLRDIPGGTFIVGSDRAEREIAYALDERGYGHDVTRQQRWYESEGERRTVRLPAFRITATPISNADYGRYIAATGHPAPDVDRATWQDYGLVHPYARTRRFAWRDGRPPMGREDHPVVLVSHADATDYANWLSRETGQRWRLPTADEWEKAARGDDGRYFPWGNDFDPARLNSHDAGPFDTMPVGSFPAGASPYGVLDVAGQVFEWTATPAGAHRHVVKGGSWDDKGCGVCRAAAGHGRPDQIKHILIGFRLVREP